VCKRDDVESIEWKMDHSINGGPLYRVVDERDACTLTYAPLAHNAWIRTEDQAEIVGRPVRNIY
jgi:hypothetical protein